MMSLEHEVFGMRRRDYLKQAERHRLLKLVRANRPGLGIKLMAWSGRRLVALGHGLQERAVVPVVASKPCA